MVFIGPFSKRPASGNFKVVEFLLKSVAHGPKGHGCQIKLMDWKIIPLWWHMHSVLCTSIRHYLWLLLNTCFLSSLKILTYITMTSWWAPRRHQSPASRFFCSTVYSGADKRKHQSSASLALCWEFAGDRWIPRTKGQWRGKCFHLMTSSCADMKQ